MAISGSHTINGEVFLKISHASRITGIAKEQILPKIPLYYRYKGFGDIEKKSGGKQENIYFDGFLNISYDLIKYCNDHESNRKWPEKEKPLSNEEFLQFHPFFTTSQFSNLENSESLLPFHPEIKLDTFHFTLEHSLEKFFNLSELLAFCSSSKISINDTLVEECSSIAGSLDAKSSKRGNRTHNKFIITNEIVEITFEGEKYQLKKGAGLQHISNIIKQKGKEISCTRLLALSPSKKTYGMLSEDEEAMKEFKDMDGVSSSSNEKREAILTTKDRKILNEQIEDLEEKIQAAHEQNNMELEEELQGKVEEIRKYINNNTNHKGRPRHHSEAEEKTRKSVSNAIKKALDKLDDDSALRTHLVNSIKTGTNCRYLPSTPTNWKFQ